MVKLNERYVLDSAGNRVEVILPLDDYQRLVAAAEELADIQAFDESEASGEPSIPLEQAIDQIEREQSSERKVDGI